MAAPPLSRIFDLFDLSEGGADILVHTTGEERAWISEWAGLKGVERFEAHISLRRWAADRFGYDAVLNAYVVQTCVVSLEPVHSQMLLNINRTLQILRLPGRAKIPEPDLPPVDDDGPEHIQDSRYDLAAPLLEEFSLALDPYPRAAGVSFDPPLRGEGQINEGPFAVLKALKKGK